MMFKKPFPSLPSVRLRVDLDKKRLNLYVDNQYMGYIPYKKVK